MTFLLPKNKEDLDEFKFFVQKDEKKSVSVSFLTFQWTRKVCDKNLHGPH